jgi:hypothetical protein
VKFDWVVKKEAAKQEFRAEAAPGFAGGYNGLEYMSVLLWGNNSIKMVGRHIGGQAKLYYVKIRSDKVIPSSWVEDRCPITSPTLVIKNYFPSGAISIALPTAENIPFFVM